MNNYRITPVTNNDYQALSIFLTELPQEIKLRFGPHSFNLPEITSFYTNPTIKGFLVLNNQTNQIIGYAVIKLGIVDHEFNRLNNYHIKPNNDTDATFAPCMSSNHQGQGIGTALLNEVKNDLRQQKRDRIILWGGVQDSNHLAVNYYLKNGFEKIGSFEYNGLNHDMILNLS